MSSGTEMAVGAAVFSSLLLQTQFLPCWTNAPVRHPEQAFTRRQVMFGHWASPTSLQCVGIEFGHPLRENYLHCRKLPHGHCRHGQGDSPVWLLVLFSGA